MRFYWSFSSDIMAVKWLRKNKRETNEMISAVICAPLPFMYYFRFDLALVFVVASVCGICHCSEVFILMF